ncbi:MAG TPA: DUF4178 domain-containing protein [Nocardioidaceae bacterium]|nr:DUF4178 domain-containing protein [Nocardioidaceae bacterium]
MDAVDWLFVVVVGAAAVAAIVWFVRRRSRPAATTAPDDIIGDVNKPSADALRALRNGDVVEYLGHNWFVRGRLDHDEHGYRWTDHMLDDAETKRWLGIEDDESFEVSLWHGVPLGAIEQGEVGDRDVIVDGVAYRLQERGTARFWSDGATGTAAEGSAEYADYRSKDGKLLGFERFGTHWEVSLGEVLQPWEITVYPGSDRPVP